MHLINLFRVNCLKHARFKKFIIFGLAFLKIKVFKTQSCFFMFWGKERNLIYLLNVNMNTGQIQTVLEKFPGFLGVYAADQIPHITPNDKPQCLVVNLDPSWKPGSHWVAACIKKIGKIKSLEIFDSYGIPPKVKSKKGWKITYNPFTFQKPNTRVCGQYSVYFVKNRLQGRTFKSIVKALKGKKNPDLYVTKQTSLIKCPGANTQSCETKANCKQHCSWNISRVAKE